MKERIKNYIRFRFGKQRQSIGEHPMFYPVRDWMVLIGVFTTVNIVIVLLASLMYFQIEEGRFFANTVSEEEVSLERIDRTLLVNVTEFYEQRRQRFNEFASSSPETFDPSI